MKEINEIVSRPSHEVGNNLTAENAYIAFFTPTIATQNGFGKLFDEADDKNKRYAIAILTNTNGLGIKAALIDIDQEMYKTDGVYKAKCLAQARQLFRI